MVKLIVMNIIISLMFSCLCCSLSAFVLLRINALLVGFSTGKLLQKSTRFLSGQLQQQIDHGEEGLQKKEWIANNAFFSRNCTRKKQALQCFTGPTTFWRSGMAFEASYDSLFYYLMGYPTTGLWNVAKLCSTARLVGTEWFSYTCNKSIGLSVAIDPLQQHSLPQYSFLNLREAADS